jgi:hypothetical protein
MLIPYVVSFIILVSTAIIRGEQFSQPIDLIWGALAGILVMAGYGFLLHGFTKGRMGIVALVSGVLATAIPVILLPSRKVCLAGCSCWDSVWL